MCQNFLTIKICYPAQGTLEVDTALRNIVLKRRLKFLLRHRGNFSPRTALDLSLKEKIFRARQLHANKENGKMLYLVHQELFDTKILHFTGKESSLMKCKGYLLYEDKPIIILIEYYLVLVIPLIF